MEKTFKLELKNRLSVLDNTDTEDHGNIQEDGTLSRKHMLRQLLILLAKEPKRTKNGLHLKHGNI
jgi:hypothetical protein